MARFLFRCSFPVLFFCLFSAPPAVAAGGGVPPGESVQLARELLREGNPREALGILDEAAELHPGWERLWEIRVLQEACRQSLPTAAAAAAGRLRRPRLNAAQVLLFEGETMEEIAANLSLLKEAGVNTVFIRVFHNYGDRSLVKGGDAASSGVYFRTGAAPLMEDYLAQIIPVCRRLGLSIFAWMTTRRCDWLLSERPDLAELSFDPASGRILRSHSLNIFHRAVRERLLTLFRDLAAYDIDGILFQDDLVLRSGEGFSPEAIEAYMGDGGGAVSPERLFRPDRPAAGEALFSPATYRPDFWDWAAWKNRRLLDLSWEIMNEARSVRPTLRFALNLYYETVINPRMALAWYAQDLRSALGYPFDYFSLMSYHRQIGRELSLSEDQSLDIISTMARRTADTVGSPEKVIMKIQALDWETEQLLPRRELDRALEAATAVEGLSLAFVRSRSDPPLDVIRKHFRQAP